jgi:hypothetical protein
MFIIYKIIKFIKRLFKGESKSILVYVPGKNNVFDRCIIAQEIRNINS